MDPMALLEVLLGSERQKKRRSEESLWALQDALGEKQRERSLLTRKQQRLLGKLAIEEILVHDFMVFIEAIENNDFQIAQNFDENEMMNAIVTMLNSNGGDNGGFSDDNEGIHNELENAQNLGAPDGTINDGSDGSNAGGNGGDEGFNYELENAQNPSTLEGGTKDDGSEGSNAREEFNNELENAQNPITLEVGTKDDGSEGSNACGDEGSNNEFENAQSPSALELGRKADASEGSDAGGNGGN